MPVVNARSTDPHASTVSVQRKGTVAAVPGSAAAASTDAIRFRVSDESVDLFGDVVIQAGLAFPAELPAVADHQHKLDATVGTWRDIERSARETFATLHLLPAGVSRVADLVRALHAGGHAIASSVYFDIAASDIEPRMVNGKRAGSVFKRGQVREISVTNFPANPSAVAVARSLGFNDSELAALLRTEPGPGSISRTAAVAGAQASRGTHMTIQELIAATAAAHDTAQDTLATAKLALEQDQCDANITAVARATTEADALFERLTTYRAAETAGARRAAGTPGAGAGAGTAVARAVAAVATGAGAAGGGSAAVNSRRTDTRDVPAGTRLAQLGLSIYVARQRRCSVDQAAQEMFAHEPEVIAIARSLVGSADTTTAGWAAELVRSESRAMLDAAAGPNSIWPNLAQLGQSLSFAGAQSIAVPQTNIGVATGGTAWVGEAGVIPVVKGAITLKRLWRYKLGGIVPMTKELERASDPSAVATLREMLRQWTSNLLDSSMLDALPEVTGVRPAGLLNGVTPITGAAGGGFAALQKDLGAINAAFTAANVGTKPVILVPQSSLFTLKNMTNPMGQFVFPDGSSALGYTVIGSQFIAAGTMIGVAAEKFASAIDTFEYDLNDSATLTMANADAVAPTQAGAAPLGGALGVAGQVVPDGGIPVSGGSGASIAGVVAVSLWQTWQTSIRLVVPASFGMTRPGAVQQVTGCTWQA